MAAFEKYPSIAAAEHVAPALRNRVQRRAARPRLRAHAGGFELHLLDGAAVGDVARPVGGADEELVTEAVERRARARLAVEERVGALRGPGVARATDIGLGCRKPRSHVGQRLQTDGAARQDVEIGLGQRVLLPRGLRIDDGAGARHRDGLRQIPHRHRRVHRRGKSDTESMPSRITVEKPVNEKVTVYAPGRKSTRL